MAVELATGYVSLVPSAVNIAEGIARELGAPVSQAAQAAGADAGKKLSQGLLSGAGESGKKLLETLGILTVGAFAVKAAVDVEDANNTIVRSTGATGAALKGLEDSFRNVASTTSASFDSVSTTLSQLYQRTGLTGKALEALTAEVLAFNRISRDSPITVTQLTQALAGFNVPADQMGKILDHLFVISQRTGVPLNQLLDTLVSAGPIARQFGFSVEFTAGFLAQLNQAGVDTNSIMPGLRKAFTQFAKDGREPAAALQETIGQMQQLLSTGQIAAARQLAVQLFGPRGVGLVDAAIAGKFSLQSLTETIDTTGAGILETSKKTGTLAGALGILRNNLKLAFAEFATPAIDAANGALRAILPTVQGLGRDFASLPDPVKITAAALIGLVSLAGPLGNLGQGLGGLATIAKGVGTGFELAAVRGLELVDSLKAITLAGALTASALTLGLAAAGVGLVYLLSQSGKLPDNLARAATEGERFGRQLVLQSKAAGDEATQIKYLEDRLAGLNFQRAQLVSQRADLRSGPLSANPEDIKASDDAFRALDEQLKSLDAEHAIATKRIRELKQAQKEAAAQHQATKNSLQSYASSVAAGGSATDAFAKLTDEAKKAVNDFESALLAGAGGEVGYQQALLNITKAENDLNEARAGGDPQKIAEAELALQQARLQGVHAADDLDKATQDLVTSIRDGTISYDAQRAALLEQIRLHPENAAGYQLEIDKLDRAKAAVDAIPPTASTRYVVDTSAADAALAHIRDVFGEINNFDLITVVGQSIPFRAARGGIFSSPVIAAEAGTEAILPLDDPARAYDVLKQSGLIGDFMSLSSHPASDVRRGGLTIEKAYFGDTGVVADLDYFAATRMAGN